MPDIIRAPSEIAELIGAQVVIDTDSSYVYIGHLESAGSDYYVLTNLDAHDTADTKTSKEYYVHETKQLGTRSNRKKTFVRIARVVSICKLEDVLTF
ncbi:MAG TPA: hypothetical protein VKX17_09250 [Planctomycetota bacterium]|nr:hypothetical protein [Planctomycetota bacterium]